MKISELKVLESAAGFYIGRLYFDEDFQTWLPYSRESVEYFESSEQAQTALETGNYTQRLHP